MHNDLLNALFEAPIVKAFLILALLYSFGLLLSVSMMILAWLKSHFQKFCPSLNNKILDLRCNRLETGRKISFCLMKAQPQKSFWFGHMWVVWPEAPPLAKDGSTHAGFYAECKSSAARHLIMSILSPFGILTGQKPIKGVFVDDSNTDRHFCFHCIIDETIYQKALLVDTKWRNISLYALRPKIGGRTYSCRDYVFEVAATIGLSNCPKTWVAFPAESFFKFIKMNNLA